MSCTSTILAPAGGTNDFSSTLLENFVSSTPIFLLSVPTPVNVVSTPLSPTHTVNSLAVTAFGSLSAGMPVTCRQVLSTPPTFFSLLSILVPGTTAAAVITATAIGALMKPPPATALTYAAWSADAVTLFWLGVRWQVTLARVPVPLQNSRACSVRMNRPDLPRNAAFGGSWTTVAVLPSSILYVPV